MNDTPATPTDTDFTPDPALDALLDHALAPEAWPDEARQRTLDAVLEAQSSPQFGDAAPDMTASGSAGTDRDRGVLARIGPAMSWAVAAVLALGTVALVLPFTGSSTDSPQDDGAIALGDPNDADAKLAELETELDAWAATAQTVMNDAAGDAWADDALDDRLEALDTELLALSSADSLWASDEAWGAMDLGDLQREMDALTNPANERTF